MALEEFVKDLESFRDEIIKNRISYVNAVTGNTVMHDYAQEYKHVVFILEEAIINCKNRSYFSIEKALNILCYLKGKKHENLFSQMFEFDNNVMHYYFDLIDSYIEWQMNMSNSDSDWIKYGPAFKEKIYEEENEVFFEEFINFILNGSTFNGLKDLELFKVKDMTVLDFKEKYKVSTVSAYILIMDAYRIQRGLKGV